jgi:flagellar biosynthetic protein FliR
MAMTELLDVFGLDEQVVPLAALQVLGLAAVRLLAVVFVVPLLGERRGPWLAKLAVVFALLMASWSALAPVAELATPLPPGALLALALKEAALGLAVGFLAALVFYAVRMAGELIDALRGQAVLLQEGNRWVGSPTGAFGSLLLIALLFAVDGHHVVIRAVVESFERLPPTAYPDLGGPGEAQLLFASAVQLLGRLWLWALRIALPVALASLLVDLTVGLASRAASGLNAYFLALPVRALVGIAVLLVSLTAIVELLVGELWASDGWIAWLLQQGGG